MVLKFKNIFYDNKNDVPVAILSDKNNNAYPFKLSCKTAEKILNYIEDKETDLFNFIFLDLFKYGHAKILNLSLAEYRFNMYMGNLVIRINDNVKKYQLTADEIILLSVLFDKRVKVNPDIFTALVDEAEEKYNNCEYSPGEEQYSHRYYN